MVPKKTPCPQKRCIMTATPVFKSSANRPLQPQFWLLPQWATAASIPGRCGPVVWCQLSPSSSGPHYKSLFGAPLLAAPYYTLTRNWTSDPLVCRTMPNPPSHTSQDSYGLLTCYHLFGFWALSCCLPCHIFPAIALQLIISPEPLFLLLENGILKPGSWHWHCVVCTIL